MLVKTEPLNRRPETARRDIPVVAYKHLPCLCQSASWANSIPMGICDTSRLVEWPELPRKSIGSGGTEGDRDV